MLDLLRVFEAHLLGEGLLPLGGLACPVGPEAPASLYGPSSDVVGQSRTMEADLALNLVGITSSILDLFSYSSFEGLVCPTPGLCKARSLQAGSHCCSLPLAIERQGFRLTGEATTHAIPGRCETRDKYPYLLQMCAGTYSALKVSLFCGKSFCGLS